MADGINSAGTLVGSVLESAGYIYQSGILDALSEPLTNEIGALVYLVGVIVALVQLAVLKSSKMAPWLLIGPAIFLFVINERDEIPLTKWSFGSQERNQGEVKKGVDNISNGQNNPRVSKVFKRYVEAVSATTRTMVDKISGIQLENDLWMITKGSFYGAMTTMQQEDPGLKQLVQTGLLGQCYKTIQKARAVDDPLGRTNVPSAVQKEYLEAVNFQAARRSEAKRQYQELLVQRNISFAGRDPVLNYIAKLEGAEDIEKRKNELNDLVFSCEEVWAFALRGILEKSEEFESRLITQAEDLGMKPGALRDMLLQASGSSSASDSQLDSTGKISSSQSQNLVKVIAKFYLRNETRDPDIGSRISNFIGRNDHRRIGVLNEGSNNFTEKARVGASEWAEKDRLITAAHSIPTFQGLILYFLGVAFPFFALLLLIPEKSTGFLLWFLLWLWAKSWDVALAIVAQLDTIFWSIYVVQKKNITSFDPTRDPEIASDLGAAFAALEHMDPTFQMTGYYLMLAVSILAIPAVTAQFIMGSMKGGASIISAGMSKFADFYKDGTLIRTEQGLINQLKSDAIELKELRGMAYAYGGDIAQRAMSGRDDGYQVVGRQPAIGGGSGALVQSNKNLVPQGLPSNVDGSARPATGLYSPIPAPTFGYNPRSAVNFQFKVPFVANRNEQYRIYNEIAGRSAESEGTAKPFRPLGTNYGGLGDTALKLDTVASRLYDTQVVDQGLAIQKAELTAQRAHSNFESDIEKSAYELHERIAIFRGIPVPWLGSGEDASAEELGRYEAKFKEQMGLLQGQLGIAGELAKSSVAHPFLTGAYTAAKYFVDRADETLKKDLIVHYGFDKDEDGNELDEKEASQRLINLYAEQRTEQEIYQMAESLLSRRTGLTDQQARFRNTEFDILDNSQEMYARREAPKKKTSKKRVTSLANDYEDDYQP